MALVVLDVDGVLGNCVTPALETVGADIGHDDVSVYDFWKLVTPAQAEALLALLDDPEFWKCIPVYEGAKDVVAELQYKNDVVACTRPWWPCESWGAIRVKWLANNMGIPSSHVLLGEPKWAVSADFFVEDAPKNVEAWLAEKRSPQGKALLLDRPWNREYDGPAQRLMTLAELPAVVNA